MDAPGTPDAASFEHMQEQQDKLLEELKGLVKVEAKDIGTLRKELHITVPAKVITDHMEQNYSELMSDALVPGFRKGRAPRQLVEKRYGAEVRDSLTTSIVGQSFYAATDNEELDVLGEPRFRVTIDDNVKLVEIDEALQHLKLPDEGDFNYICEVELKPSFELPPLENIEIKSPDIEITDEMIDEQILRHRKNRGRYEPAEKAEEPDDQVIAEVTLTVDGNEVKREDNVTLGVRPTRLDGVTVMDLGEKLKGAKPGDTCTSEVTIPDDFESADLRGKTGAFNFRVHEVKRLAPEPLEDFIKALAFENEQEMRDDVRADLEAERTRLMERARRIQVEDYLLDKTSLELPEEFSGRQTDRAVMRRVIDMQQNGVPLPDIEARIDELRTSAREDVARELRLGFIFERVADELSITVTDEEVNTEIARIAQMYGRRFDRVRDDLQNRGLLKQLVEQIRQNKCVAQLLDKAKVVADDASSEDSSEGKS